MPHKTLCYDHMVESYVIYSFRWCTCFFTCVFKNISEGYRENGTITEYNLSEAPKEDEMRNNDKPRVTYETPTY